MICPICNEGKLVLFQDAVIGFAMYQNNNSPMVSDIKVAQDYFDNQWVECLRCHENSTENFVLNDIYKRIGSDEKKTEVSTN
jgi:hypothetical protein